MDRTQKTEIVNMCMICHDGHVLVQDKIHDEWGGFTFPGGHVEWNESFADAVIREVFEETGLTIGSPQLCGIKDWINEDGSRYMVLFYKTDQFSGDLKPSAEGEVFWVDLNVLLQDDRLALDMKDMIKVFTDNTLSEFFYYKEDNKWRYQLK
ncbi:MAG: 8-oxo-dGTP diphosphatase [Clostridia bacterium]|nr:8-oxo-dGTP diphosphatase [Clostridia bacterium]